MSDSEAPGGQQGGQRPRPVVLCILDGFGYREAPENNAIAQADTPVWDRLWRDGPRGFLDASAGEVGLPAGQMGNSEVGHMNIGAGRIVLQDLPRIDKAVADRTLAEMPALADFVAKLRESGGTAHLMGLLSPGGVHSHQDHLAALANVLTEAGVPVCVHAFLDGRDTPPRSALDYVARFEEMTPKAKIATVSGRYYPMDRDKRWERVQQGYDAIAWAKSELHAGSAVAAIEAGYARNENDEFVQPTVIGDYAGMQDGDGVLMGNFRADRARELLHALIDPDFAEFDRGTPIGFAACLGMVSYSAALDKLLPSLFAPPVLTNTLGEAVAKLGLSQLRIAETEKYAHVTFFLNGGREEPFAGEERILVPSPKVATYDLQPEMSAVEVTDRLVEAIESGRFDLIVVNYANPDMVGHTGVLEAAAKAIETVDVCLGRLEAAVRKAGGAFFVTADHGNAEMMLDPESGQPHTAHTMNKVPAVLIGGPAEASALSDGRLADIAPTLLDVMGLEPPAEMEGRSLLPGRAARRAAE